MSLTGRELGPLPRLPGPDGPVLSLQITEYLNAQESAKSARVSFCLRRPRGAGGAGSPRVQQAPPIPDGPASVFAQLNLWRYGDFRADDADEFGYSR